MATKLQLINEAYERTGKTVVDNPANWQAFLSSACRNYKCRFDEQLLIFAQRPDAIAVLPLESWNKKFSRWINKGANGIAVFDSVNAENSRLKYYFDISDTHGSSYARPVPIWQMKSQYEGAVIDTLESTFGELSDKDTLPKAVLSAARNAAEDNLADYLSDLVYYKQESFLEEMSDDYISKTFKELVTNSVAFMLLTRLGYDSREYFTDDDFRSITEFNTNDTLNAVGLATSDISEMGLREIASTVISLQKAENNKIRIFADSKDADYNVGEINNNERVNDNDRDNLQSNRRLQHPEPDITAGDGSTPWEVRIAEKAVSGAESQSDVRKPLDILQTERASNGNRENSSFENGSNREADGTAGRRNGETESRESNGMGRQDEQYQTLGGRDNFDGTDLQLMVLLPSVEEQQDMIEEAEDLKENSAFSISQEDIDAVLTRGSGVSEGKYRIYDQFQKQEGSVENIKFLKDEYGWGGSYPAVSDRNLDEGHDGNGIKISKGSISNPTTSILLPWTKVEKRIGELIDIDRYLNEKENAHFPEYLKEKQDISKRWEVGKEFQAIISKYNDYQTELKDFDKCLNQYILTDCGSQFAMSNKKTSLSSMHGDYILPLMQQAMKTIIKENTPLTERALTMQNILNSDMATPVLPEPEPQYRYEYHLGDMVYIGADKYEILSVDDTEVRLFDDSFPLVNKIFERSDFDHKVKENPANDHLRVVVEELSVSTSEVEITDQMADRTDSEPDNSDLIGKELTIDNRKYLIENVKSYGDVSMRDITFEGAVGFPINRLENAEYIRKLLSEKEKEVVIPAWEKKPKSRVQSYDLYPEIKQTDRNQFVITDDELGAGGAKEKFRNNINAINVLKKCELDGRYATYEEQEILSKFVGWGSLSDAFDENKANWANEFTELYTALSPEEYAAARESTLTAFYTSPIVIKAMYQTLENMGFKQGNILEPSCGTGNFIGMLPESMKDSKIYGVELDSITGRIAQQLYQKSSIAVQGFETTNLPDSFFDVAIGNVPFGQFKVSDKRYDKQNWLIHDYFFGKTLDKVRPGGVVAFITSKGTLDKENPSVRKYIAQRADLLGAIRLPNNAFSKNAGTEVTADIIFLQKRDRIVDIEPDWVHLGKDENGILMNSYFVEHPDMLMGEMVMESTQYGMDSTCKPYEGQDLGTMLSDAIQNVHAEIAEYEVNELTEEDDRSIPADPTIRNFSYALVDGTVYFRENSRMSPIDVSATAMSRIKGMIELRDCVRSLIEKQTEDYPDSEIQLEQERLNVLYNAVTKKYGLINSRANNTAFSDDSSYCLLCSLEVIDENGNLERKADMFSKRTIKPHTPVTSVDTASEALAVSVAEKAYVDMPFMQMLTGKTTDELESELAGVIFRIPNSKEEQENPVYQTADEYLSGNVREKLERAKMAAEVSPLFESNVKALQKVQPVDLTASEISVRIGATWLPPEVVSDFIFDLLDTPRYAQWNIKVHYSKFTSEWNIEGKNYDRSNIKAYNSYGTSRINAYKIIEETLNLKDVRIFDYVEDADGRKQAILNKKETAIAQGKQEQIKAAFTDWTWKDPQRREQLVRMYNDKFNAIRPREYDGNHITFGGINPEIKLNPHQVNAVAHIMYGGNTLLAHCVGAGKTFEMVAAAMESKRLGLCNKSLFVVPNHITEQWASEFLQLYPSANILVATKKDFETKNRKKFCGRIATGDYDAVIIGHSQFEKIPMSIERQRTILEQQLDEVVDGITELKHNRGDNFSVKQLEKTRKSLKIKLEKLNDQSRKDDVVTFEELGVDRVFIDESHYYKNLYLYTKMRNVGGIAQTEAMKSSDLFMKSRYLDELTGGRGLIFATGTPISNSMVELYTIQRYLQYNTLQRNGLQHFDAWASTFGETVTAIELSPEGTGYRAKTRFAKFYNLPELMCMVKEVADIQTADVLNLPVPEANYHNVAVKPSKLQTEMVAELSERADRVRNKMVDSSVDNMLKITNDGRKLALDQRLMNDMLPDFEDSKINACVDNIYRIWEESTDKKSAQLVFCDLSTPKNDGSFSVYQDMRDKLISRGIPAEELQFIHDADSEVKKKELFAKVRKGDVRVLFGSTAKLGAGTNVQDKLIALHDCDCPWRPSDLEQRSGRIIRQGNENPQVEIYRYVTEQTFDAYLYQLVENKQKFISQIMTSKSPVRSAEDIDETALSYAEIKMLATGNPYIKEKMDLDIQVSKLKLLKQSHLSERYALEDKLIKVFPKEIKFLGERITGFENDIKTVKANTPADKDTFAPMKIGDKIFTEKADAGQAILDACKAMTKPELIPIGEYRGFAMSLEFDTAGREYKITLKGDLSHKVSLGSDVYGNITRIDNIFEGMQNRLEASKEQLENTKTQMSNAEIEVQRPFPKETELKEKTERLDELNVLLNMDKKENEIVDGERSDDDEQDSKQKNNDLER